MATSQAKVETKDLSWVEICGFILLALYLMAFFYFLYHYVTQVKNLTFVVHYFPQ